MTIGIVGAMEEEVRLLRQSMTEVTIERHYGNDYYVGKLSDYPIVLVQSGIGKVNATMIVTLMHQLYDLEVIINTGSAGALDDALRIGDVLIAHSIAYHDVDLTAFGYEPGQMAQMPAIFYPDSEWVRMAQVSSRANGYEPYLGLIVSGDQFISESQAKATILEKFPQARACEMESTAIAHVGYALGVPTLIIRAISDEASDEASIDFDTFIVEAGRQSATLVMSMIAHYVAQKPRIS